MTIGWPQISGLFRLTLRDPREGAEAVLALPLPRGAVSMIFVTSVLLSTLVSGAAYVTAPPEVDPAALPEPFVAFIVQFGLSAVLIITLYWIGKLLDGQGSISETMLIVSWLQLVILPFTVVALFFGAISTSLGVMIVAAVRLYEIWLLVNFVQALHRLSSLWQAAKMILLAIVGLALGLALFSSVLGIGLGVGA
ncbi:MAG: YIP1 family protein [Pseudomonadota bacterium]